MRGLIVTFGVLALAAGATQAQEDETQEFVKEATVSNNFEIASSELALERSQNRAIRRFAEHMIEDHRKAGQDLEKAAGDTELGVGTRETLDKKHAGMMQELGDARGAEFDRLYVEMQVAAHDEAVDLFEDYVEEEDASAPVQRFARETLPVLEEHERQVRQLDRTMARE